MLLKNALGLAALLFAAPAISCQYEFAPEPVGGPSAKFLAAKMGGAATYIDLAIAEGAADVRTPDGKVTPWAKAISFRVIDRWKGQSPDRFILFGEVAAAGDKGWSVTHWVDDQGRVDPFESVREASVVPAVGMNSCDPPTLTPLVGQTYVVLREADGRLLRAVEFHPGSPPRSGTAIAAAPLWPNDEWGRQLSYLRAVPALDPTSASTPIDPSHATVRFRRPLDLAAVERLLGQTKAAPFAATLLRGTTTSEYRLDSKLAWPGLVSDAARWAEDRATEPELLKAQSAKLVDAISVRELTTDTAWLIHARSVVALADAAAETGPARFVTIGVVADAAVQRALAADPDVAEVIPARLVRARVATAPARAAASPLPDVAALDAYRRLTAIAGKELPEQAITGRWRMTGADSMTLADKVFTLEMRNGKAIATMPCARSQGTYRFAGRVLELRLPKPDLSNCPKNQNYWYPAYLFDTDGVVTVKPNGETVDFVVNNGTFHFRREAL